MNSDPLTDNSVLILRDAARSLEAAAGEIVLLIGEVGSGKSLWLKRLAGLASFPPQFTATIAGKPPGKEIGAVQMLFDHQPPLWLGQNIGEELSFGLKAMPSRHDLATALATWGVADLESDRDVATLNRLQSVRLRLAAMELSGPVIALLDNPSDALPEADAVTLRDDIAAWVKRSNTTVVVASNRWHDWQPAATQLWRVTAADFLPNREGRHE
ncbi:energy-coupling factor transport system ATP-binding protein [Mariprofundus ferrinatatus]|uniref:Energy-coupling factor transport system ATP-binding protein n=1 Tax=Mariprofundus ferrinatatus TaxID=1921087 RepID=A0A2K8L5X1_9PROT|nr:ATP-binding cassette domain-containing protein [Mariprofundus ferrinatatus]ATX82725.1 energy-coupling factor transport system ATP-binding protein [Mariprofundus ferrinatatus]